MKYLILILALLLAACNPKTNSYIIKVKNANGLEEENSVYIDGVVSGKVSSLTLSKDHAVLIKVNLFPDVKVPVGCDVLITKEKVLFAAHRIEIKSSNSQEFLSIGDTLNGSLDSLVSDSENVKNLIRKVFEIQKKDSLLKELKREVNH